MKFLLLTQLQKFYALAKFSFEFQKTGVMQVLKRELCP